MTKFLEWLSGALVLGAVWVYLITNKELNFDREQYHLILYSPIIFILIFGLYALTVVLYRVYTFNNCEEAAAELQKEIKEAHEELKKLGFKFKEKAK